jgi:tRNA G10  N-methylase Trm11
MSDHRIVLADCLGQEGLATLADKSVDHVICDPPYSAHTHANVMGGNDGPNGEYFEGRPVSFPPLSEEERRAVAGHIGRLVRRWVVVFSDHEETHLWRSALEGAGLEHIRTGIWLKLAAPPQFTGDRPANGYESIVIAHPKGRKRWNGGGRHATWTFDLHRGHHRDHDTQKPVPLMEALVRDFTDPGDLVVDPFAGSGTTGVACRRLGRRFLGFERDAKYAAIAEKRIAGAREQMRMFEGVA